MKKGSKKIEFLASELIDFNVVGILSNSTTDYKFAYLLNNYLGLNFKRIENLDHILKNKQYDYMVYESYDNLLDSSLYLLKNQPIVESNSKNLSVELNSLFTITPFLIPEIKNCNYLLKIEENYDLDGLMNQLKKIPHIQFSHLIENGKYKSLKKLIF